MDSAALQKYLLQLFERHDVELEADEDGWLVTDGDFPAIRAAWHAGAASEPGRLDVDVVLSEERYIEESFAGAGGGDTGCRDALRAFEHDAFHPLLAACWYVTDDRRMRIAAWEIGVRTWDVFIGPFSARGADAASMPTEALASIETALKREALSPELHWVRLVHSHAADGDSRCEALLDNELWTAGTLALASVAWPQAGDYSARCFLLLDVRDY
ncbi:DUF6348 family protein [Rhodanobacter sp. FW102-FHT14D06]|uniref:DUF6348 family protein n=2 Tax=unclassified Rhodanobacter TaxID=2621553 RepID=A0AB74UWF7_9GAMM